MNDYLKRLTILLALLGVIESCSKYPDTAVNLYFALAITRFFGVVQTVKEEKETRNRLLQGDGLEGKDNRPPE